MSKKNPKTEMMVSGILTDYIFILLLCIVPLYFEHAYYDMLQAKMHVFLVGGLLAVLISIPVMCKMRRCLYVPDLDVVDLALLGIAVLSFVSALLSQKPEASLFGHEGWGMGAFTWMMVYLLYRLIKSLFKYKQNLWLPVIVVNAVIFFFAILDSLVIDVFGFRTDMVPGQILSYLSTLGGINWVAGYLCLMLPIFICMYMSSTDKKSDKWYLIFLVPAMSGIIFCDSDSVFLGLGAAFVFGLPWILKASKRVEKLFLLGLIFGIECGIIRVIPKFDGKRFSLGGFAGVCLKDWVIVAMILVCLIGYLLVRRFYRKLSLKQIHVITWGLEILMIIAVALIILLQIKNFSPEWGSKRGIIWKESIELYTKHFTLKEKVIGIGPELLLSYYESIQKSFQRPVATAHNVFLDMLLSHGIIGLILWMILWIRVFIIFIKEKIWKNQKIMLFLPLVACLAQSILNSWMVTNVGIFCLMLAMYVKLKPEELG